MAIRLLCALAVFVLIAGCITQLAPNADTGMQNAADVTGAVANAQGNQPSAAQNASKCENSCGEGELLGAYPDCQCIPACPDSCDDSNPCTSERCAADTLNACAYTALNGQQPGCADDKANCLERSCVAGQCIEIDFTNTSECSPGGANAFTLTLQVLDRKKSPIPGLDVAYSFNGQAQKTMKTDATGKLSISGITASPVTVLFIYEDQVVQQDIPVTSDSAVAIAVPQQGGDSNLSKTYVESWVTLGRTIDTTGSMPHAIINPYKEVELFWMQDGRIEFATSQNGFNEWLYLGTSHSVPTKEPGGKKSYDAIRSFDVYKVNSTHWRLMVDGSDLYGLEAQTYSLLSRDYGYTWQPEIGIRLRTLNWTTGVNNNSGQSPSVIGLGSEMFRMYYVDNDSNIKSAISYDDGFVWDRENVTCIPSPADAPSVIKLPNGTFRMFYSVPKDIVREKLLAGGLRSALSQDGTTFTEEYDKRVAIPDKRYIIMEGGRVALLPNSSIVLEETTGPQPVREMSEQGDITLAITSALRVLQNGTYQLMFLLPEDVDYTAWNYGGIKSALSDDGLSWAEEKGYRLTTTDPRYEVTDPDAVMLPDNRTLMYYSIGREQYTDYAIYAAEQQVSWK